MSPRPGSTVFARFRGRFGEDALLALYGRLVPEAWELRAKQGPDPYARQCRAAGLSEPPQESLARIFLAALRCLCRTALSRGDAGFSDEELRGALEQAFENPDLLLLQAAIEGSEEAWRGLAERVRGAGGGTADELLSLLFLARGALYGYEGRGPVGAWLRRLGPRAAGPARAAGLSPGRLGEVRARGGGPAARAEEAELRERVRRGLAGLPAPQAEVVVLRALEELSFGEVARVLGLPHPNAARRLWLRASAALRRELGRGPGDRGGSTWRREG